VEVHLAVIVLRPDPQGVGHQQCSMWRCFLAQHCYWVRRPPRLQRLGLLLANGVELNQRCHFHVVVVVLPSRRLEGVRQLRPRETRDLGPHDEL
jgi:hypothetical protein